MGLQALRPFVSRRESQHMSTKAQFLGSQSVVMNQTQMALALLHAPPSMLQLRFPRLQNWIAPSLFSDSSPKNQSRLLECTGPNLVLVKLEWGRAGRGELIQEARYPSVELHPLELLEQNIPKKRGDSFTAPFASS